MRSPHFLRGTTPAVFLALKVDNTTTLVEEKPVAKYPAQDRDTYRKRAYAEHRLIVATDRYITARTTAEKEKARKWIGAWRAFCTSRRR